MSFRAKIALNLLGYDLLVYSVVGNPVFIHSLGAHISMLAADEMKSWNDLRRLF